MDKQQQAPIRNSLAVSYALTVSGEAAQAAFHFLLNIMLIREFVARDYGIFAIVFTVGAIAVLNINAIFAQPVAVFIPRSRRLNALSLEVTMGSMAFLGCAFVSGVVGIVAAIELQDPVAGFLAGGFTGLWPLRIYAKAVNFARCGKRGALRSTISDICYALASALSLALLHFGFGASLSLASAFASLCVGNVVGVLIQLSAGGRSIRLRYNRRAFAAFAKFWPEIRWSLVGTLATTILGQSQMGYVTLLAGPAAFAPLAAGFVLMSPIRILTLAVLNIMRPDLSRSNARGDHHSAGALVLQTAASLAAISIVYGVMLRLAWPMLDGLLFAKRFGGEPMGLIVILAWLLTSIGNGTTLMQARAQAKSRFREAAWPTLGGGVLTLLFVPAFLLAAGPALSTVGAIIGEIATLSLLWTRRSSGGGVVMCEARKERSFASLPQNSPVEELPLDA